MSRWSGVTFEALQGLGVGVAGPQPAEDSGDEVQAAFGRRFTAPVRGDNTRFAALAEALAAGSDARDVLHVRLSDVPGARGMAGGTHAVRWISSTGLPRAQPGMLDPSALLESPRGRKVI